MMRGVVPRAAQVSVAVTDPVASVFVVSIQVGGLSHELVTGWAGEGWPADVERLVRLAPHLDAVGAQELSVGSRELLDDRGIGWFDETGAAHLLLDSGLVIVRDGTPRRSASPLGTDGWTGSTIAVAEAILTGSTPHVDVIQTATGLSRGAVAKALAQLESEELLERSIARGPRSGRRVADLDGLLDRYSTAVAAHATKTTAVLLHRLWSDPIDALTDEIAPALQRSGASWAVTGAAASMLLAPYLSNIAVVELYVDDELFGDTAQLEELLDARHVDSGHRIHIRCMPTRTTATEGQTINGVRCAPLVRVYADLTADGGRRAEAGQHLREVRIDARTSA